MEITDEKVENNKYLDRKVITFTMKKEKGEIIKLEDVKSKLAEKYSDGFLVIYTLKNVYGKNETKGIAHLYTNEDTAKKVLQKAILKKNSIGEDGKEKQQ